MSTTPADWSPVLPPLPAHLGRRPRLDAQELRRRAWHMGPGLLPFILWAIPHRDPLSTRTRLIFAAIFFVLTAAISWNWRRIAREGVGHADRLAAVYGYAGSVLLTILLFPGQAECGLALLAVLAFGDGAATLVGKALAGPRLPWNPAKSVAGLAGFFAAGVPMTAVIYWGESHNLEHAGPSATWAQSFLVAAAGVAAGALAESIPSRLNDNIRVGLAAAAALLTAHAALFGL